MAIKDFNYKSARAEKARIWHSIGGSVQALMSVSAILLVLAGLILVATEQAIGWIALGFAFIPAMIVEWKKGELDNLTVDSKNESVDGLLSGEVLGLLSSDPSPYEVTTIVGRVYSGQFFGARFGIGAGLLQEISSKDPRDAKLLWDEARKIQQQTNSKYISAGVLLVAIIRLYPNHDTLLAHLQIDIDDLVRGISWQTYIDNLIESSRRAKLNGGIARDWSFGWIPNLSRFGQNISSQISSGSLSAIKLGSHEEALDHLLSVVSSKGQSSAVLVGKSGVGKTTVVYALAEKLLDAESEIDGDLRFNQVFILDAVSLISAAPGRGELETLVNRLLSEAYRAKNIIPCLDNAQLFFEEGVGSVDISNILLPILESGNLKVVLTMNEQKYLQISSKNPQITSAMSRIAVDEPDADEVFTVMENKLIFIEYRKKVTYMYQAIREAYRLSSRYIYDLYMPGRAIKLLESAAEYAEGGLVTARSVQQAIEKTQGIKLGNSDNQEDRDKLLNLEALIHERMINQSRAVSVVSDALRRARSGVRNPDRPIGTFMFLGPTGVGKTELAKALASVYFGGEDRIIRLDMNEYVTNEDVARLIADGADDSTSLTAQIMKQPFSVVLLDEIEKAHPNVLTTFLQLLDEGILRDSKNREVSFRDAIIIATSNAGADSIRENIERGLDIEKFEDQLINQLISGGEFKPEFLNRFDEIVMFRPLTKEELLQVVNLILVGVNKTLALQKVSVDVSLEAKQYLVNSGYDPRLGARPMRRVVQKAVENTVAKKVLSGEVQPGGVVSIDLETVKGLVDNKLEADSIIENSKDE